MIKARVFSELGENEFRKYIQTLRQGHSATRPDLNIEPYSKEYLPSFLIDETKNFSIKMELAEYLDECFRNSNIKRENILVEKRFWTWLAYIWFDQLAPVQNNGIRRLKEDARYICSSDYRDYYRHLISGNYSIYSMHGRENSRIFLYSPIYEHNDFIEQVASRQFIISHKNIVETINKLYLDIDTERPKKGAQSRDRPGNFRRFIEIIQQFELTYDIYNMSPEKMIALLPSEFNEWR